MADNFKEYLVAARKEAERNLYDIEGEIQQLRQRLALAEEQRVMFQYVISDLTHKLGSLSHSGHGRHSGLPSIYGENALLVANDGRGLFGFARNALAHGIGSDDRRLTIREMVIGVLSVMNDGLDVNQIIEFIQSVYGVEVARTSLSPQLSRMKSEGDLELKGDIWSLPASELTPKNWEEAVLRE